MSVPLLITARLSSPLAGEPPHLDALLEWLLSPFAEGFREQQAQGVPHHRVDRNRPAPSQGSIRIPLERAWLGDVLVARCSNPIIPLAGVELVDHVCKRLAVEEAASLAPAEYKIVSTSNTWAKSYRLPLRVRAIDRVCWFASGTGRELRKVLKDAHAVGKKVSYGYGRVREWVVEEVPADLSWFAPATGGPVLMRTLPRLLQGSPWLPENLQGAKQSFGACSPPYWHQDRFTEIVSPC